jgi:hypothetical protein
VYLVLSPRATCFFFFVHFDIKLVRANLPLGRAVVILGA